MAAKLARVNQKIFGSTGGTGEFGQIGSDAAGSPVTTKDLTTIQALSQYDGGLYATDGSAAVPPRIQDFNSLFLLLTTQLRYLFQNGIPEWDATAEYYANISFVQVAGVVYRAKTGDDATPNVNHNPSTDSTYTNWELGDASLRQIKFDLESLGLTFTATDMYNNQKIAIAMGHGVGELVTYDIRKSPVTFALAKSTANPSNAEYFPVIPRYDGDHDVTTAQAPLLVTDFRTRFIEISGTSIFSGTVATSRITFANNTTNIAMLNGLQNAGFVNRWYSSGQSATYAASGPDYTYASRQYCINVAGTDYPITNVSVGSLYIDVTGTPPTGSQSCIIYPFRISGSTTSIRLRSLKGFVPTVGGDVDGDIIISLARMDFGQGHYHNQLLAVWTNPGSSAGHTSGSSMLAVASGIIGVPITDGTNGTPRTGKNTTPRTAGMAMYTWARTLLATNWTTA